MKKTLWKFAMMADGILAFIFVSSFDVDEMVVQYVGALICLALGLFLLAIGWQWIMDTVDDEDTIITDIWEYKFDKDRKK